MSLINLFWQLNVADETRYLFIFFIVICICAICFYNKNKNKKNTKKITHNDSYKYTYVDKNMEKNINRNLRDDYYNDYLNKRNKTNCHTNYMACVENNEKNNTDDFCFPCLNDGLKQDFFYDPVSKEWISNNDH